MRDGNLLVDYLPFLPILATRANGLNVVERREKMAPELKCRFHVTLSEQIRFKRVIGQFFFSMFAQMFPFELSQII
jgi:hypothetical protein